MLILDVAGSQMPDNAAHLGSVRTRGSHAILSFTHFARGDHFHRLGDLLRVLNASDLGAYFFCAGHISKPDLVHAVGDERLNSCLDAGFNIVVVVA